MPITTGTLLGDCWSGFQAIALASDGRVVRAACNSHARRKIRESAAYPQDRAHWMAWYHELYDIETRGKVISHEERLALRQAEAQPIWDAMQVWLEEVQLRTSNVVLPKSDFGKALQYIRNHFTELKRYLNDALIPIDNNETEQLMKQVAVGRKNWLFSGSVAAGERSAGFMTLVSSALRNDLDVWQYINDVLSQLLSGVTDYEPLTPLELGRNPSCKQFANTGSKSEKNAPTASSKIEPIDAVENKNPIADPPDFAYNVNAQSPMVLLGIHSVSSR